MPTITDEAVVLRRWDFSETSQMVSLFTRAHGVVRGLAKGAKREKSPYSGGFEPLTRGHVAAIVKPSTELANVIEWDLAEVFQAPRRRLEAHHAALYLADLVHHAVTDHDPHPALYERLVESLRGLETVEHLHDAVLRFQWALLVETGYRPMLDRDAATGRELGAGGASLGYSPTAGGVVAEPTEQSGAGRAWRVRSDTIELLRSLEHGPAAAGMAAAGVVTTRAAALLALHLAVIMDRDLPTRKLLFGPIPT
ncbi:MAG TPA: DNA repair protein RecO [Phycisphaerales bacterium]|nr:DNA repair protein RecO [Phycisphaerales bacterium]